MSRLRHESGPSQCGDARLLPQTKSTHQIGKNARQAVRPRLQDRTKAGRAERRQAFIIEAASIPRFQGQTFLEQHAVSQEAASDYMNRMNQFRSFAAQQGLSLKTSADLDDSFTKYRIT